MLLCSPYWTTLHLHEEEYDDIVDMTCVIVHVGIIIVIECGQIKARENVTTS